MCIIYMQLYNKFLYYCSLQLHFAYTLNILIFEHLKLRKIAHFLAENAAFLINFLLILLKF